MTGQFVNEAAIICGGKNSIDNLNTCHEYNHIKNEQGNLYFALSFCLDKIIFVWNKFQIALDIKKLPKKKYLCPG